MHKRCTSCNSCGMPFEIPQESEYCQYCTHEDGTLKSYDEILEGMTDFIVHSQGVDKSAAKKIADQTLKSLPTWKKE